MEPRVINISGECKFKNIQHININILEQCIKILENIYKYTYTIHIDFLRSL